MTQICLKDHDSVSHFKTVSCTELLLPSVIQWKGKFYAYKGTQRINLAKRQDIEIVETPLYTQCRGAILKDILFRQSVE